MEPWILTWLEGRFGDKVHAKDAVRLEDYGVLPLRSGEITVWHPLDDIDDAPHLPLEAKPRVASVWMGKELVGWIFREEGEGEPTTWEDVGDAGTDTDRFFLLRASDRDAVVAWFNDEGSDFEELGGETPLEMFENDAGARVVVIASYDGNAVVKVGTTSDGTVCCAVIET